MKHDITVFTLSRKWGGRCVAGYDHNDKRVVRLVSDKHGKEVRTYLTGGIELLDIVRVEVVCSCPCEHQTENVLIDSSCHLTISGISLIEDFDFLTNKSGNIFGDNRYKIENPLNVDHSLEVIKFSQMSIYAERGKTKADFYVEGILHKRYSVTDIVHEGESATIKNGYAIITIPPSDDFSREHGYYKYIAAIYPTEV